MRQNRRIQLLPWRGGGGGGGGQLVMCGVLVLAATSRALITSLQVCLCVVNACYGDGDRHAGVIGVLLLRLPFVRAWG